MMNVEPGIELPNNAKPNNYPQNFEYSNLRNHNYPVNNAAKNTPASNNEVMKIARGA